MRQRETNLRLSSQTSTLFNAKEHFKQKMRPKCVSNTSTRDLSKFVISNIDAYWCLRTFQTKK
jgi:hypothetical protein